MILEIAIWEIQTLWWWLSGEFASDVIGLSIGPIPLYKQKLNFGKAPLLVAWPMRLQDGGTYVTMT